MEHADIQRLRIFTPKDDSWILKVIDELNKEHFQNGLIVNAVARETAIIEINDGALWFYHRRQKKSHPPRNAKFALLLFISKEDREVQLGDLEETYYKVAEEFGSRRANFWYRSQVVRSLGPWMWTLIKRWGIASGGLFSLSKVTEFFGRLLGG